MEPSKRFLCLCLFTFQAIFLANTSALSDSDWEKFMSDDSQERRANQDDSQTDEWPKHTDASGLHFSSLKDEDSAQLDIKSAHSAPLDWNHKAGISKFHHDGTLGENSEIINADAKMAAYLSRQRENSEGLMSKVTCDLCYLFVKTIKGLVKSHKTEDFVIKTATKICILFRIEDRQVCKMIVQEYRDEIFYLARHLSLEPWQACGIVLSTPCNGKYYPGENWTVPLPPTTKPKPSPPTPPKPSAPRLKVLHFTDLHLDLQYQEGSNVDCGEPICCRDTSPGESKTKPGERAGKYGVYGHCDVPSATVVSMFQHLSTIKDQFAYALFTGDIPAHDIWNQSKSDQLRQLNVLDNLFQTYLPGLPVYWAMGNHESAPCNSFVIPGVPGRNMSWLYEPVAKVWGRWLPESSLGTVRRCAGYSVSPYKGFRIISINNNYCNKDNPWILLNTTDPCNTLNFLVSELQAAEDNNEKVHILTHIPPGNSDCLKVWSHNYYDIINRYENTVVNQFYGHNHRDWFMMFYDTKDFQRPLNFGFVAPSVTSRDANSPVYRVYEMDGHYNGSSWAVLDYTNYYLNLTKANLEGKATWTYSYNPKKDLNMKSLYAADWEDLVQRMEADDELFQKFYLYYYSLNMEGVKPCNIFCKSRIICAIKEGRSYDYNLCNIHH